MAAEQGWFYRELGRRLRSARKEKGVSQEKIGQAAGLSRTSVTNIEKGRQPIDVHALCRIAATLQLAVTDFIPDLPVVKAAELPAGLQPQQREWVTRVLAIAHAENEMVVADRQEANTHAHSEIQRRKKEGKRSTPRS